MLRRNTSASAMRAFQEALAATAVRNPRRRNPETVRSARAASWLPEALIDMAEAFLKVNASEVSDTDLVAVLLAGAVEGDPKAQATEVLADLQGNLARVGRAESFGRRGFGPVAHARVVAASELARRAGLRAAVEGTGKSLDLNQARSLAMSYAKGPQEQMLALYFDHDMRFLGIRRLHVGAQTNVMADAREIVLGGLEMRAAAAILVHNHPSGNAKPSPQDDDVTMSRAQLLAMLGIELGDHLIVGKRDVFSYTDSGRMQMLMQVAMGAGQRRNPAASENGRYRFVTDCIGATAEDISALKESGEDVSRTAFARALGPSEWKALQKELGYGRDFPISGDWHIDYRKGTYRGVPAYYLVWSAIEYVFTLDGKQGPSLARGRR